MSEDLEEREDSGQKTMSQKAEDEGRRPREESEGE